MKASEAHMLHAFKLGNHTERDCVAENSEPRPWLNRRAGTLMIKSRHKRLGFADQHLAFAIMGQTSLSLDQGQDKSMRNPDSIALDRASTSHASIDTIRLISSHLEKVDESHLWICCSIFAA